MWRQGPWWRSPKKQIGDSGRGKDGWGCHFPADILMGVDKGLEAAEVINWGGVGHMFPVALKAILADTTNHKIIETRTMVGGGENGKLIRVDGIQVKGKKASTRTWTRGGCGRGRSATARRCATSVKKPVGVVGAGVPWPEDVLRL